MATYEKRGNRWRVRVMVSGQRKNATFATKRAAETWAAETHLELEAGKNNDVVPGKTVKDAFQRYAKEKSPAKKGCRWEQVRLEMFERYKLADMKIAEIRTGDLAQWRDERLQEVKPSSVRRELQLISGVLTVARAEWHWLSGRPMEDLLIPKKSKPRDRLMTAEEIEKILAALTWQPGDPIVKKKQLVACFMLLAIETAMRLGEMCSLLPEDFDLDGQVINLRDSKNDDKRAVPLSRYAIVLARQILQSGLTVNSATASAIYRQAVQKAGIKDLKFHDTRHEAITRLARKLDVLPLARMVGHRDPRSLMIYYNEKPSEIADLLG